MRPVLRYLGGKNRLANWIVSSLPSHKFYIEPFGGAGSILMNKPRSKMEIYNDICGQLVSLFRLLQDPIGAAEFERICRLRLYSTEEYRDSYVITNDPVINAVNFVFRSFAGFGSSSAVKYRSFRRRMAGNSNSPAMDWATYPDAIKGFTERLQGVVIENQSAFDLIPCYDSAEALFYIDPPYLKSTRTEKKSYTFELSDEEHVRLLTLLNSLKGTVFLSGYDSQIYSDMLTRENGWVKKSTTTQSVANTKLTEVLWCRNLRDTIFD